MTCDHTTVAPATDPAYWPITKPAPQVTITSVGFGKRGCAAWGCNHIAEGGSAYCACHKSLELVRCPRSA